MLSEGREPSLKRKPKIGEHYLLILRMIIDLNLGEKKKNPDILDKALVKNLISLGLWNLRAKYLIMEETATRLSRSLVKSSKGTGCAWSREL